MRKDEKYLCREAPEAERGASLATFPRRSMGMKKTIKKKGCYAARREQAPLPRSAVTF
ncbi:hypothetical protein EMIT0P228_50042 [Pseudomonas brassicacearum]